MASVRGEWKGQSSKSGPKGPVRARSTAQVCEDGSVAVSWESRERLRSTVRGTGVELGDIQLDSLGTRIHVISRKAHWDHWASGSNEENFKSLCVTFSTQIT